MTTAIVAENRFPVEGPFSGHIECQVCHAKIARYWVRRDPADWRPIRGCEDCMARRGAGAYPCPSSKPAPRSLEAIKGLVEYEIYQRIPRQDGGFETVIWEHGKVSAQQMEEIRRESVRHHPERTINMVFPSRWTSMGTQSFEDWMRGWRR